MDISFRVIQNQVLPVQLSMKCVTLCQAVKTSLVSSPILLPQIGQLSTVILETYVYQCLCEREYLFLCKYMCYHTQASGWACACGRRHTQTHAQHRDTVSGCDLEHSAPQWSCMEPEAPLGHLSTPHYTFSCAPACPEIPRWTLHLHKGANAWAPMPPTLFIVWSAMIDALLIQI